MPADAFIVLACSKKIGGLCVAGIKPSDARWIRPVSGIGAGQLYPSQCEVDGHNPRHLDIVSFRHTGPTYDPAQPENVLITADPWRLDGAVALSDAYETLRPALVGGPALLGNCGRAVDDEVAQQGMSASLALVEPDDLQLVLEAGFNKPSPRAQFRLNGCFYNLPITDFEVGPALRRAGWGTHDWEELGLEQPEKVLLSVSLGEPIQPGGPHWKLVAGLIRLPGDDDDDDE